MEETRPYTENESGSWRVFEYNSFYEDSDMDNYLNKEFLKVLGLSVQDSIV